MFSSLVFALVYLRDHHDFEITTETIFDYLILDSMQKLSKRRDIPAHVTQGLKAYLRMLPGYRDNAPKQNEIVTEQHGYVYMIWHHMFFDNLNNNKKVFAVFEAEQKNRAALDTGREEFGVVEYQEMEKLISQWSSSHTGGMVVVDGFLKDSPIWKAVLNNMVYWREQKTGLIIGLRAREEKTLPEEITDRAGGRYLLAFDKEEKK